jgi:hypothetical protein
MIQSKFIILSLFLFLNYFINGEKTILRIRNSYLRLYISQRKHKTITYITQNVNKSISKNINVDKYNNSLLSKFYDVIIFYYSLSDEELELIDNLISLCY